jgi:PAS domain S-box-containing protein
MKTILVLDGAGYDREALEKLLRDHGYAVGDISESVDLAHEVLRRSERRCRAIIQNAPVGIFRITRNGRFRSVNPALARILKYDSPEALLREVGRSGLARAVCLEPSHGRWIRDEVLAATGWRVFEERLCCRDGSVITCQIQVQTVAGGKGKVEFEGFVEDITERKRVERALRFTQFAIDKTTDQAFWMTADGRMFYVNDAACRALGYSREELIGMTIPDIDPNFPAKMFAAHWRELREKGSLTFESLHRAKNGRVYPVEIRTNYVVFDGREYNCAFATDITERKRAEEKIKTSLAEKEVLLKEIHHRVKNNLQVVSSLLFLQADKIRDPELVAYFTESQNRILSMALAHEQLYQSRNLAEVHLGGYVQRLVGQIEQTFQPQQNVICQVAVEDIVLDVEQVVPCGLLITELLSNAFKHAFPDGRSGTVEVAIRQQADRLQLSVRDDGIGLPADLDPAAADTLGLQLVRALTEQLDGILELDRRDGTRFRVSFPIRCRDVSHTT